MSTSPTPLASFAALAADLCFPAASPAASPSAPSAPAPSHSDPVSAAPAAPADSAAKPHYPAFAVSSPMSTASTASGPDSPTATVRITPGLLITSRCSTPERAHSPLSLDATTASSSASSSRAPSPTAHLTLVSSPAARGYSAPGPSSHASISMSPAISPISHPVTPPSPAHSSASLSSSASSSHSASTPSKASSCSSNYRPERSDRRSGRSKRIPLSATQKAVLEEFFRTNHYPTRDEKTELGTKINLTSDKVHKWYDNRRTKMNKDGKIRRVEDARLQHLYNNFSDASALYTTTAVPFDVKPLAVPMVPAGGLSAMQLTPMAHSTAVHPFLHAPMMAASVQQDEAWKRAGGMQDAQQQLFQAQLQFHMTQNAINLHQQQHQQQQQQMATAAAANGFFQSAPIAPTSSVASSLGTATSMAAPLNKLSPTSAFHTVTPASLSPAAGARSTTTALTTSTSSPGSSSRSSLLSPTLKPPMSTPVMPLRPLFESHPTFTTSPSLSYPPASPATALSAHSLLSPVRPAAQLAYGTTTALQQALAGMASPPLYMVRQ